MAVGTFKAYSGMGMRPIADSDTVQRHTIGTRAEAIDEFGTYAKFVYLKGVASTVAGDFVTYNSSTGVTARSGAASKGPGAVAMSANVANQFGWYAIAGRVKVNALTVVADSIPYVTATAGTLDDAVVANQALSGARFATADAAGQAEIDLNYPSVGEL